MITAEDIEKKLDNDNNEKVEKEKGYTGLLFPIRNYERLEKKKSIKNLGRNDKCICGSGKKLKKCCLNKLRFENMYEIKENKKPLKKQQTIQLEK